MTLGSSCIGTGTINHTQGAVNLNANWTGTYTQAPTAGLLTTKPGAVTINGPLNFASSVEIGGKGAAGSLTASGINVNSGAPTLNIDLLSDASYDRLTTSGNFNLSGNLKVNLNNFRIGTYTGIITAGASSGGGSVPPVTLGGRAVDSRHTATLNKVGDSYNLALSAVNGCLNWSGATDGQWDTATPNWENSGGATEVFIDGDALNFGALAGNKNITLSAPVTVAGMQVGGAANYSFNGAAISGDGTVGNLGGNGGLTLALGAANTATFGNDLNFADGINLMSGNAVFNGALSGAGDLNLRSPGGMVTLAKDNTATGLLNQQSGSLALNGNWGGAASFMGPVELGGKGVAKTISIGGNATFNGATLGVDTISSSSYDKLNIGGLASFIGNSNAINLSSFTPGSYTLVSAGSLAGGTGNFTPVTFLGQTLATWGRRAAIISNTGTTIKLTLTSTPTALTWTGANGTWDTITKNWKTGAGKADAFINGDTVTFNTTGKTRTVSVANPVIPAAMTVTGAANYAFTGAGTISGSGKLTLSQGASNTITFANPLAFKGGISLTGGKTVTFNGALSGAGGLLASASGSTVTLAQNNTATGLLDHRLGVLNLKGDWKGGYTQSSAAGTLTTYGDRSISGSGTFAKGLELGGKSLPATLNVLKNAAFNGAALGVNIVSTGSYDKITVGGTATVSGAANSINLYNFVPGSYNLITSTGKLTAAKTNFKPVTFNGAAFAATDRRKAAVSISGNIVKLALSVTNMALTWTGASGTWDSVAKNWKSSKVAAEAFVNGDTLTFDATGKTKTVAVANPVTAKDMTIKGAVSYSFTGAGTILGTSKLTSALSSASYTSTFANPLAFTGGVAVTGGKAVFNGALSGAGGLLVNSSGGAVTLAKNNTATGLLDHRLGALSLNGDWAGAYSQAATAGTLTTSEDRTIGGNAAFGGTLDIGGANKTATLSIGGNASFNAAKLNIDVLSKTSFDKIVVTGGATFTGANNALNLSSFIPGGYDLLTTSGDLICSSSSFLPVTLSGQSLTGARRTAAVSVFNKILHLNLSANNASLTWAGAGTSANWDSVSRNWKDGSLNPDAFVDGDVVTFGAAGAAKNIIVTGPVTVADMNINDMSYTFSGAPITVDGSKSTLGGAGKLSINQPFTVFNNALSTVGGISVNASYITFNGVISGAGGLLVNTSANNIILAANNTATGLLDHKGMTLTLSGDWAGSYKQTTAGYLFINGDRQIKGQADFAQGVRFDAVNSNAANSLSIGGNATFSTSDLFLGAYSPTEYDHIKINGTTTFNGTGASANTIHLTSFTPGTYNIISSTGLLTATAANFTLSPVGGSYARRTASLAISGNNIQLILAANNTYLNWSGATNTNWNSSSANWKNAFGLSDAFIYGDAVNFGTQSAAQIIEVDSHSITTSQMLLSAGSDYTFTNGKIAVDGRAGNYGGDGSLTKSGTGALWFKNSGLTASGPVNVTAGTFGLGTNMAAAGSFTLAKVATLSFSGTADSAGRLTLPVSTAKTANIAGKVTAEITGKPVTTTVAALTTSGLTLSSAAADLAGTRAFYTYNFAKSGNNLNLTVTAPTAMTMSAFAASLSPNSLALFSALPDGQAGGAMGQLTNLLYNAITMDAAREIINAANSTVLTSGASAARSNAELFRNAVSGLYLDPLGAKETPAAGYQNGPWRVNFTALGAWGRESSWEGEEGFDLASYSGLLSLDHSWQDFRLGAALSIGDTTLDWDDRGDETDANSIAGALYSRYEIGSWFLGGQFNFGWANMESKRHIDPLALTADADYSSFWYGAGLQAGYMAEIGRWTITPSAGINFLELRTPSVTESGAGNLNLHQDSAYYHSLELIANVTAETDFFLDNGVVLTPKASVGVSYETQDDPLVSTSFPGMPAIPDFNSVVPERGALSVNAGVGLSAEITDNFSLEASYNGRFREHYNEHQAQFSLQWSF